MIRIGRLALLLCVMVLVQITLLPHLRVAGVVPDVVLVATVAVAYREGPELGAGYGFASGLVLDLFLQTPLGLSAICFALTGYLVGVVQGALVRTAWWVAPILGAFGGIVGGFLFVGIGAIFGQDQLFTLRSVRIVLQAGLLDAIIAPIVFPLVAIVTRDPGPRPRAPIAGPGW